MACGPCLRLAGRLSGVEDADVVAHEADTWWALAWPLGLTAAARLSLVVVDQAFVGHLGTAELAGASLAGVWIDVMSGWLWPSFGAAVNTLSAQAIGARNPGLAGVWMQTGLFLSTLAALPVALALILSEPVYLALGFGSEESRLAGQFASWIATGILPAFWYLILASFLKAQRDVMPAMLICLGMVLVNAFLNVIFIHGTSWFQAPGVQPLWGGMGFEGSPIATATTRWLSLVAIAAYIHCRRAGQAAERSAAASATSPPSDRAAIAGEMEPGAAVAAKASLSSPSATTTYPSPQPSGCCDCARGGSSLADGSAGKPFLSPVAAASPQGGSKATPRRSRGRLPLTATCVGMDCREALSRRRLWQLGCAFALPLALSNLLEELQLQVVAFMAAELGQAELAAHTSMLTLFFFCSSAMYSAVQATSTRVAHHLGAGNVPKAKLAMWIDVQFSIAAAVSVALVMGLAGENLARIFSNDPAVLDAVRPLSALVGCAYGFICIFFCSVAVLDAMGKTSSVAIAFVTGAWMVAVPSAYIFDRVLHLGLIGLWYGLVAGYSVVSLIALWFLVRADWEDASRKAIRRAAKKRAASLSRSSSSHHGSSSSHQHHQLRFGPCPPACAQPRSSPLRVVQEEGQQRPVPGTVGGGSSLSLNGADM